MLTLKNTPVAQNDIINGRFMIANRGTSFAATANGAYDLNGWLKYSSTAAVITVAQVAGSTTGRLARQTTVTTADTSVAAGDNLIDVTKIEGYNIVKYIGNTFTIGFRAKVPVAGIHCVSLGNSGSDRSYVHEINFPSANTWQDCTVTVVGGLPTSGTWNYTNGVGLVIGFVHLLGTNFHTTSPNIWNTGTYYGTANQVNDCASVSNVWAIEEVTINLGTAVSITNSNYATEQAICQRYLPYLELRANSLVGTGPASSATTANIKVDFPAPARIPPTDAVLTGGIGSYYLIDSTYNALICSAATFGYAGLNNAVLAVTSATGVAAGTLMAATTTVAVYFTGSEL